MKLDFAKELIRKTREDYNLISEQFSSTREFLWQDLKPFLDYTVSGDKVLDLGCGNGRLFPALKEKGAGYIGVDISPKLIGEAKKKFQEADFRVIDILELPFSENYFDKIYCIAVLHHIPSEELRIKALKEARRALKPNAKLILTVWNLKQRKGVRKLALKEAILRILGKSQMDFRDILLPWKDSAGKVLTKRYYHIFTKRELKKLAKKAGFKINKIGITDPSEKKERNIYLIAEK